MAHVGDARRLEQEVLLGLGLPGLFAGGVRRLELSVAFRLERRGPFGRHAHRLELRLALDAQGIDLRLSRAEGLDLRVSIRANRLGLRTRRVQRFDLGVPVGTDRLGLKRGLGERVRQCGLLGLTRAAFLGGLRAHGVQLLLRFGAVELKAGVCFLERERAGRARSRPRFLAGRLGQPLDEFVDGSRVDDARTGESGRERLATRVDGGTECFEFRQRRPGRLRDESSNGRGGLGLRVVLERLNGVVWRRIRGIHFGKVRISGTATRGPDAERIGRRSKICCN